MPTFHIRNIRLLSLSLLVVGACATSDVNHYKPAVASQELCCNRVADPNAKQACLADIPRTQDESSTINQELSLIHI